MVVAAAVVADVARVVILRRSGGDKADGRGASADCGCSCR